MKKFLISLTMAFIAICAFAAELPTAPTVKTTDLVTDGSTVQYLYNVEAKVFFVGGNDWGTRASVAADKGYPVKITLNEDGETYRFNDQLPNGNWNAVDCDGDKNMWVDGANRSGDGTWTVSIAADGSFTLANNVAANAGFFGIVPSKGDTRTYLSNEAEAQVKWAAVSEEAYAEYVEAYADYAAALEEYNKSNYKVGDNITFLAPATWAGQGGTYGGLGHNAVEVYSGSGSLPEGDVLTQTLTGLKNGTYQVSLELAASYTDGRGFECPTGDGLAEAFANDQAVNLPVVQQTWVSAIDPIVFEVEVTDGTLTYGSRNLAPAGNWYVANVLSIVYVEEASDMPKAPKVKTTALVTDGSTVQYLYNVEAKAFFAGGNDWGTRASIAADKGYPVKITLNEDGETYKFNDQLPNGNWNAVDCDGDKNMWVDGANRSGDGTWTVSIAADGSFTLANNVAADAGFFGVVPSKGDTRTYLSNEAEAQIKWVAVSEEAYAEYMEAYAEYAKAMDEYNKSHYEVGDDVTFLAPATWDGQGGTYGGLGHNAVEVYSGSGSLPEGNVLTQTLTGLKNGTYEVSMELAASYTDGRGFECPTGDGLAEAFANDKAVNLPVVQQTWVSVIEPTVIEVSVTDGTLTYGSRNLAPAGNWYVANLVSIKYIAEEQIIEYPEVALDSTLTFEPVDGGVVVKLNSVEGLDAVVNDAKFPELNDRKLSDFTYMKVKATIFEIDSENNAVAVDDHGWYQSVADPVTEGDTITYDFKPATSYKIVVNKIALIDGRNGNLVTDKDYNAPYEFATGGFADGIYYIANADTKMMFLEGNNSWGTQASVGKAGAKFQLTKLANGAYSIVNTDLSCAKKNLGSNLYVDADQPANGWVFNEVQEHLYTIALDGKYLAKSENIGANNLPICELVDEVTEAAKWVLISADNMSEIAKEIAEWAAEDVDVTFLLKNPGFNRNTATDAWVVSEDCTNKNLAGGANENFCAESWRSVFTISQTIEVPNGKYEINAQAALTDYAGLYDGADYPVVFANEGTSVFCEMEEEDRGTSMSKLSNSFTAGKYAVEPIIVEVTDGQLTVGVKGTRTDTWCIWDNFQIIRYAETSEIADGKYYITNTKSNLYLQGENSWGTQASVGNAGALFELTKLENGAYSIVNTELTVAKKNLGANLYVDSDQPANGWELIPDKANNGNYAISLDGKYLAQSENLGVAGLPVCELVDEITDAAIWKFINKENVLEILEEKIETTDVTFLLKNPGFNRNTATDAWEVSEDCTNKNLSGGDNDFRAAESWQSVFTISQTIEVPNGKYAITANAALTDYAGLYDGADYPVVFANEASVPFCEMEEGDRGTNMAQLAKAFAAGNYQVEPIEVEVTDGKLTVGVKGTRTDTWCIWDNFRIVKQGEEPVTKPILIAFDRIAGQGYTGDEIPYNEEEILAALKITSWDQITTMYPANMETGEPAQDYDGWRSPSGSPTAWGDNSYACVKYPHDGSMFLCTMPGNEPKAGTEFNCAWILGTEDNNVCVMITVNFIEAPKFALPIADLAINKEVKYELTEGAYVEKKVTLSDDEVSSICEELGIKSLDEATVYGFNPTDESLLTSYAGFDGWRDGEGNFHNWTGDGNAPACVKYTNGQEYLCYNIGGLTDQTIKTYWAIGNGEKVVLVCIDFVYGTGVPAKDPTGINGIAGQPVKANGKYFENGKVVIYKNGAKYSVSGAALK
ncbi:MAG: hypothetical protein KBT33_13845 [Prevotellaceae bacterium]|nr:hypothetical protein [Candidatus Minthosoma equi]